MTKNEELKKELDLAREEILNIKRDLAKVDRDLSKEVSDGWVEVWLKKVKKPF